MLITRPFTNAEVADLLQKEVAWSGIVAEACRRLRGEPGSGEERQARHGTREDCADTNCRGTMLEEGGRLRCIQCRTWKKEEA